VAQGKIQGPVEFLAYPREFQEIFFLTGAWDPRKAKIVARPYATPTPHGSYPATCFIYPEFNNLHVLCLRKFCVPNDTFLQALRYIDSKLTVDYPSVHRNRGIAAYASDRVGRFHANKPKLI